MKIGDGRRLTTKVVAYTVCVALVSLLYPARTVQASDSWRGAASAREAAAARVAPGSSALSSLGVVPGLLAFAAAADTTQFEFPEEEKGQKHLVRDIAVFVMVSAFVGYFLVKVFLEGDNPEPPSTDDGKHPPNGLP